MTQLATLLRSDSTPTTSRNEARSSQPSGTVTSIHYEIINRVTYKIARQLDLQSRLAEIEVPRTMSVRSLVNPVTGAKNRNPAIKSQPIAEWHGQVTHVDIENKIFIAELRGALGEGVKDSLEEGQIPLEEVPESDIELVKEGAFFRLCINYEYSGETRRKYTQVIFRRLPAYRREELEEAKNRARELHRGLLVE